MKKVKKMKLCIFKGNEIEGGILLDFLLFLFLFFIFSVVFLYFYFFKPPGRRRSFLWFLILRARKEGGHICLILEALCSRKLDRIENQEPLSLFLLIVSSVKRFNTRLWRDCFYNPPSIKPQHTGKMLLEVSSI